MLLWGGSGGVRTHWEHGQTCFLHYCEPKTFRHFFHFGNESVWHFCFLRTNSGEHTTVSNHTFSSIFLMIVYWIFEKCKREWAALIGSRSINKGWMNKLKSTQSMMWKIRSGAHGSSERFLVGCKPCCFVPAWHPFHLKKSRKTLRTTHERETWKNDCILVL